MMNKQLFVGGILLFVIALGSWFLFSGKKAEGQYDEFAQCLTDKGVVMYGADWCPHCQNEKKAFGSSFEQVKYVECPDNPQLCLEKGIERYPTWMMHDGRKLVGEQGPEKLSRESGCPLPKE